MSDTFREPMPAPDRDYFANRAETERRLAEMAIDERAKAVHEQLAEEYALKAQTGPAND